MVYPEHPFAKRDSDAVSELKDEPFIALGNELSSRKMFDEVLGMRDSPEYHLRV